MANDPSSIRHNRDHGERIAALEERHDHFISRLNHIDDCIDGMKVQVETEAKLAREDREKLAGLLKIGLGIILGMMLLSGTGPVSLHSLISVLSKINP